MKTNTPSTKRKNDKSLEPLRKNDMMAHLLDALDAGKEIGKYGQLTFTMVARHFMDEEALVEHLAKDPSLDEVKARALVNQVNARGYNPPKEAKIMQWQKEQEFPICPGNDPDGCNVYRNLQFPDGVFEKIQAYHEEKAEAEMSNS